MQVNALIRELITHSGLSANAMSAALGKSREWARLTAKANAPRVDTLADVADVAGVDVALIDRTTGEVIAKVDPPRRAQQ